MSITHCVLITTCLLSVTLALDPRAPSRNSVDNTIFPVPGQQAVDSLGDESVVNVHIIMHTHDDLGWLETFDQYYKGNRWGNVSAIYNRVIKDVDRQPDRKFSAVEMGFFMRWYNEIDDSRKKIVKELINNKHLEILNGGYAMNDEACTYYDHIINQYYVGHRFIREEFGYVPRAGWAIDPFGHSSGHADLLRQMGYNGFFVERIHYLDFQRRYKENKMEFLWKPNPSENMTIFGSVNSHKYGHPPNFSCESILCSTSIQEGTLQKFNAEVLRMSKSFASKQFLWHVGDDFTYSNGADTTYRNIEAMRDWYQNHSEYKLRINFSTVESYLWYVNQEQKVEPRPLSTKTDDFFPYLDTVDSSWTGYFTSKPRLKGFVYEQGRYYNALQSFFAKLLLRPQEPFMQLNSQALERYDVLSYEIEKELAMMTHHDAITGTEKKYVVFDYIRRVSEAFDKLEGDLFTILRSYIKTKYNQTVTDMQRCLVNQTVALCTPMVNGISKDEANSSSTATFMVVLNSFEATRRIVRFRVPHAKIMSNSYELMCLISSDIVYDENGQSFLPDVICDSDTTPENETECDAFFTDDFSGFSMKIYKIVPTKVTAELKSQRFEDYNVKLDNGSQFSIQKDGKSISLKICTAPDTCISDQLVLDYKYYMSSSDRKHRSGCYSFQPTSVIPTSYGNFQQLSVVEGDHLIQIKIVRSTVITRIRIYYEKFAKEGLEIESFILPLDISGINGKEVIMHFTSSNIKNTIDNIAEDADSESDARGGAGSNSDSTSDPEVRARPKPVFYTDANGLYMQKRIFNHKEGYNLSNPQVPSVNYYPVTSAIYMEDKNDGKRLTLMNDRSQGGSSLGSGQLELMLHRAMKSTDSKGLGEGCDETEYRSRAMINVTVTHRLYLSDGKAIPHQQRQMQSTIDSPLHYFFAFSNIPELNLTYNPNSYYSSIPEQLFPSSLKIQIRIMKDGGVLARFFNQNDEETLKTPFYDSELETIKLINKFCQCHVQIKDLIEVTLTGHIAKEEAVRDQYQWDPEEEKPHLDTDYTDLTLKPLEFKAFYFKALKLDAFRSSF